MRLLSTVNLCIPCLTVEGSGLFGQCVGKCGTKIFNWEEDEQVKKRLDKGMSALYFPAVPVSPAGERSKVKTTSQYEEKMILDSTNSDSFYHPLNCRDILAMSQKSMQIQLGLGSVGINVWADLDCNVPRRAGKVGMGPYSRLMKAVKKLELTIKRRKYRTIRSGDEVDTFFYIFADHFIYYSAKDHSTQTYQNAWSVNGSIRDDDGTYRKVRILLRTLSSPKLIVDATMNKIIISGLNFYLRGDQFFWSDDDTIVVNPIVLGYYYDISILFDVSHERGPRVGFNVLKSNVPFLS